jgi:hypothetical protein
VISRSNTRLFIIENNSYRARKGLKKQFKRKIYLAFEGLITEPNYFKEVKPKLQERSNTVVDVILLNRSKKDGKSHPYHVRDGMLEFYDKNNRYIDKKDGLWIVIDIDRHFGTSETEKKSCYQDFLNSLKSVGGKEILAAVSMPCFELWLILHYQDLDNLDLKKIKANAKIGSKNTYPKKLLKELRDGNVDKGYYLGIDDAIKRAKSSKLESQVDKLYSKTGTLVCQLIEDILSS